jgi:hypothetical protein
VLKSVTLPEHRPLSSVIGLLARGVVGYWGCVTEVLAPNPRGILAELSPLTHKEKARRQARGLGRSPRSQTRFREKKKEKVELKDHATFSDHATFRYLADDSIKKGGSDPISLATPPWPLRSG